MAVFSVSLFKCCAGLTFKLTPSSYPKKRGIYCLDILALEMKRGNTSAIGGVLGVNLSLSCNSFLSVHHLWFTQGSTLTRLLPALALLLTFDSHDTVRHSGLSKSLYGVRHFDFLRKFWLEGWRSWGYWPVSGPLPGPAQLTYTDKWYCTWPFWFSSSAAGHEIFPEIRANPLKFSLGKCVSVCVFVF